MVNSRRSLEKYKSAEIPGLSKHFFLFFCFLYQYINKIISLIKTKNKKSNNISKSISSPKKLIHVHYN